MIRLDGINILEQRTQGAQYEILLLIQCTANKMEQDQQSIKYYDRLAILVSESRIFKPCTSANIDPSFQRILKLMAHQVHGD